MASFLPKYLKCIYILVVIKLLSHFSSLALADISNCSYDDTVDLSGSLRFPNGSYLYENVILLPELVGTYDYELRSGGVREAVPEHIRGCVCQLKSCVKFCCKTNALKVYSERRCTTKLKEGLSYSPYINITLNNGSHGSVHVTNDFVVQEGIPCTAAYALVPEKYFEDKWNLFENGTLFRSHDAAYLSKRQYCLSPYKLEDVYVLNPLICALPVSYPMNHWVNIAAMLTSIPFLLLTTYVYVLIPELRNLHGNCLVCYLISLALGYALMVVIAMPIAFSDEVCSFIGYTAYFCFMAVFYWLSVISFDLWHNFRWANSNVQRFIQSNRFYVYSLYAWFCPVLLTGLTFLAQISDLPEELKPGIGDDYCWLKTHDWSAVIYFYGPNLLLVLFNISMFTLTSIKIYRVKKELDGIMAREEGTRHLRRTSDNYSLFLRLFIVMGVSWVLEFISFMIDSKKDWSILFYIPDLCNAAQGIIIFVLFVLKRKVKLLIKKRILRCEKNALVHTNTTTSESASEKISLKDHTNGYFK